MSAMQLCSFIILSVKSFVSAVILAISDEQRCFTASLHQQSTHSPTHCTSGSHHRMWPLQSIKNKLQNVAVANALQLEAAW